MADRKIILIGRHGKAPQRPEGGSEDTLVPEAISEIYTNTGIPLQAIVEELGIKPETTFLRHTDAVRTKYTGQAVLIGAFNMQPSSGENPPKSQEDLAKYDGLKLINTAEESNLNIGKDICNIKIYKQHEFGPGMDYWLKNPDATEHEGEKIQSYRSVDARCREGMKNSIATLVQNNKDLGVLVTHTTITEPIAVALINSGRKIPVEKISDIGGTFKMAEFAQLVIDQENGVYKTTFELKGQRYNVNLGKALHY